MSASMISPPRCAEWQWRPGCSVISLLFLPAVITVFLSCEGGHAMLVHRDGMIASENAAHRTPLTVSPAHFPHRPQVGTYLDRHLVFPLLEFLQNQSIYPEAEVRTSSPRQPQRGAQETEAEAAVCEQGAPRECNGACLAIASSRRGWRERNWLGALLAPDRAQLAFRRQRTGSAVLELCRL